jgi:hypothetical protein
MLRIKPEIIFRIKANCKLFFEIPSIEKKFNFEMRKIKIAVYAIVSSSSNYVNINLSTIHQIIKQQ